MGDVKFNINIDIKELSKKKYNYHPMNCMEFDKEGIVAYCRSDAKERSEIITRKEKLLKDYCKENRIDKEVGFYCDKGFGSGINDFKKRVQINEILSRIEKDDKIRAAFYCRVGNREQLEGQDIPPYGIYVENKPYRAYEDNIIENLIKK